MRIMESVVAALALQSVGIDASCTEGPTGLVCKGHNHTQEVYDAFPYPRRRAYFEHARKEGYGHRRILAERGGAKGPRPPVSANAQGYSATNNAKASSTPMPPAPPMPPNAIPLAPADANNTVATTSTVSLMPNGTYTVSSTSRLIIPSWRVWPWNAPPRDAYYPPPPPPYVAPPEIQPTGPANGTSATPAEAPTAAPTEAPTEPPSLPPEVALPPIIEVPPVPPATAPGPMAMGPSAEMRAWSLKYPYGEAPIFDNGKDGTNYTPPMHEAYAPDAAMFSAEAPANGR